MQIRRPQDLGAVVREARHSRKLSQEDLARQLGVSRLWVNEFERGKRSAGIDTVLLALNVLGVTLDAALEDAAKVAPIELAQPPATSDDDIIDMIANTGSARQSRRGKP